MPADYPYNRLENDTDDESNARPVVEVQMEDISSSGASAPPTYSHSAEENNNNNDSDNSDNDTPAETTVETEQTQRPERNAFFPVATPVAVGTVDGVFSNTIASSSNVPEIPDEMPPKYEEDRLPSYNEVTGEGGSTPPYEGVVLVTTDPDDETINGIAVGSSFMFVTALLMSWFFGLFGFICMLLISRTFAARHGATAGLGLMIVQFGYYYRNFFHFTKIETGSSQQGGEDEDEDAVQMYSLFSYLAIISGWIIFLHSCIAFMRVRRIVQLRRMGLPVNYN